jgi:hypothetical protein
MVRLLKYLKSVSGMNYYACVFPVNNNVHVHTDSIFYAIEGPQLYDTGWQEALEEIGLNVIC